jgi:ABC-type transporter Mla subunit MlaD
VSKRDIKEAAEVLFIVVGLLCLIWVALALDT